MPAKFVRLFQTLSSLLRLPFISGRIPDLDCAEAVLKQIYPDQGKSCWLEHSKPREITCDLSVIIPSYNNEQYVLPCVRSVLEQRTDVDFEVIVVNDGSTDSTRELLEDAFSTDPRVRLVHQPNKGLSGARNTGIELAEGRYFMFVDSDDRLMPGAIQNLMHSALDHDANIVAGSYTCLYPDGTTQIGHALVDAPVEPMSTLPGYAWGKVYRAELFDHLRFPEGYWFEDSISAQILWPLAKGRCWAVKESVYEYLMNPQGISAQAVRKPKALDSLWLYRRLLEERKHFGLGLTQADYEHFLEMVRLTYSRTRGFPPEAQKSIFAIQMQLRSSYFQAFTTQGGFPSRCTEKALRQGRFRSYVLMGELPL